MGSSPFSVDGSASFSLSASGSPGGVASTRPRPSPQHPHNFRFCFCFCPSMSAATSLISRFSLTFFKEKIPEILARSASMAVIRALGIEADEPPGRAHACPGAVMGLLLRAVSASRTSSTNAAPSNCRCCKAVQPEARSECDTHKFYCWDRVFQSEHAMFT